MKRRLLCWLLTLILASTCAAEADEPATFSADGWLARCDAIACKASLPSAGGSEALLIARWAGSSGLSIGLAAPRTIADVERPIDVRIDDKSLLTLRPGHDYAALERAETIWITDPLAAATTLKAALNGGRLRIAYLDMIGAPHDADFSLSSLANVVNFFGQQQRLDGPPAAAAPPLSIAHPPAVSRIDLIIRMGLPDRLLQRHARANDCEDPRSPKLAPVAPVIGALSRTAILYGIPCTMSAKDVSYKLWVVETGEIGGMTPLNFALYDPKFGWQGSDLLYNVAFEPTGSRLTSTLALSPGHCGHRATWHWQDYAFALDTFDLAIGCATGRASKIYPTH